MIPLWIQVLIPVVYIFGFFFIFEFFFRNDDLEDEEEPDRHRYSVAVICAALWPLMFVFSIVFSIHCLLRKYW